MQAYRYNLHNSGIRLGMPAPVHKNQDPQNRLGGLDNNSVYGKSITNENSHLVD